MCICGDMFNSTYKVLHMLSHAVVCPKLRSAQLRKGGLLWHICAGKDCLGHGVEGVPVLWNTSKASEKRISSSARSDGVKS